ncbi:hypothetical protein [Falsiroseomonas sp. CW058]|uniref:hypothetical protein n=1 Tax=Falsiroseomonas sp. CW058 TaxID=3388664 RepID=UPI003D319E24
MPDAGRGTALRADLAVPLLQAAMRNPRALPLSSIVCTAVLSRPRRATTLTGAEGGDSERADHHVYAWPLFRIRALEPVVPATGRQGFWHHQVPLPEEIAA